MTKVELVSLLCNLLPKSFFWDLYLLFHRVVNLACLFSISVFEFFLEIFPLVEPVNVLIVHFQLYILTSGKCIYSGSLTNLLPYMETQNLKCPKYHNPADFSMSIFLLFLFSKVIFSSMNCFVFSCMAEPLNDDYISFDQLLR